MSITYNITTNFGAKDALPANDANKVIRGTEFTTEFNAIRSAFLLAAPTASPTFTGTATFAGASVTGALDVDGATTLDDVTIDGAFEATSGSFLLSSTDNTSAEGPVLTLFRNRTIPGSLQDIGVIRFRGENGGGTPVDYAEITANQLDAGPGDETVQLKIRTMQDGTLQDIMRFSTGFIEVAGASLASQELQAGNGSASDPSITFSGDTDTGMYRRNANQLGWSVGGQERMWMELNGLRVTGGIEHFSNPAIPNAFRIRGSTNNSVLTSYGFESTGYGMYMDGNQYLAFSSGGQQRLTIKDNGDVGIGTNNPTGTFDVSNNGSEALEVYPDAGSGVVLLQAADRSINDFCSMSLKGEDVRFTTGLVADTPAERMRIAPAGNVGIGTNDPQRRLHVSGPDEGIRITTTNTGGNGGVLQWFTNTTAQGTIRSGGTLGNAMAFFANGGANERMRIDTSGNVAIGTTSASERLRVRSTDANIARFVTASATGGFVQFQDDNTTSTPQVGAVGNALVLRADNLERARITSGIFCVGKTAPSSANRGVQVQPDGRVSIACADANGEFPLIFSRAGIGTAIGSVQTVSGGVLYNTASDERLKDNIEDAADSGSLVDAIRVRQFDWKEDGAHQDYGFIAQELDAVFPGAVSHGSEDGDVPWAVDNSKLVPLLVKELQELRKRVAELEAK
jgi:hypothetical protein